MSIVQNMLCTPGSGCYIYSLGDGLFMSRVLGGIAMLNNSSILMSLGKVGFMLGILLTAAKGVMTQKLDLAPMLIGFIVFFGMFGSKTQVTVIDMGGAPGVAPGGAFPVGNVPYGLALAGSMVSNMGLDLAQYMEQAFGLPNGYGGISDGGFGESLRWIDAVRNWELPEIDDMTGDVSWFKSNLTNYLGDCFMNAVDKGQADVGKTFQTPNPWVVGSANTGGIGVTNQFLTTQIRDSTGQHDIPCNQAFNGLTQQAQGSTLYNDFASSLFPRGMKMPAGVFSASQALSDAFQDVNISSGEAQSYVMSTALQAAWEDMMRHNGQNSPLDALGDIMVSQAAQQRATQWAASESMFRRVAQPMIAFFESMFYACAPFMALCLGFGEWGTRMIARYLILSIWVMLWFPVLSIVNLFQLTMVQHAINVMQAGTLFYTSVAGVAYLQSQIVDWLSTGAMLASATPAITLMLIFGGAVPLSALAGRMGGDAHVDPKVVSPDAVKTGAALNVAPGHSGTQAGGVIESGAEKAMPHLAMGANLQSGIQSALGRASETSNSAAITASQIVGQTHSSGLVAKVGAEATDKSELGKSLDHVAKLAHSYGWKQGDGSKRELADSVAYAFSGGANAKLSAGKGPVGASAALSGAYEQRTGVRDTGHTDAGESLADLAEKHSDLKFAMNTAYGEMVKTAATQDGQLRDELKNNTNWQEQDRAADSAKQSYQAMQGFSTSGGVNQNIPANNFGETMKSGDPSGEGRRWLISQAQGAVGQDAINANMQALDGWKADPLTKQAVAAQMALMGTAQSKPYETQGDGTVDREAAALAGWRMGGGIGGDVASSTMGALRGAGTNAGISSGVPSAATIRGNVGEQKLGSPVTPEQVTGEVHAMQTPTGQAAAKEHVRGISGVSASTQSNAEAVKAGGMAAGDEQTDGMYKGGADIAATDYRNDSRARAEQDKPLAPVARDAAGVDGTVSGFASSLYSQATGASSAGGTGVSALRMAAASGTPMSAYDAGVSESAFSTYKDQAAAANFNTSVNDDVANVTAGLMMLRNNVPLSPSARDAVAQSITRLTPEQSATIERNLGNPTGLESTPQSRALTQDNLSNKVPAGPLGDGVGPTTPPPTIEVTNGVSASEYDKAHPKKDWNQR
ncbi:MAG: conjugal transfer protein TraG N-terminal domain-containing protein [Sulfuricaulis sp.]